MIHTNYEPRVGAIRAKAQARAAGRLAFDAFLFSATVGIWGFILSLMALKWVMP